MKNIIINGGLEMLQHKISRGITLRMMNACLEKKGILAYIECSGTQWVITLRDRDGGQQVHLALTLSHELVIELLQWAQKEIKSKGEISSDSASVKLQELCSRLFSPRR